MNFPLDELSMQSSKRETYNEKAEKFGLYCKIIGSVKHNCVQTILSGSPKCNKKFGSDLINNWGGET